jgi:hypothetical protein
MTSVKRRQINCPREARGFFGCLPERLGLDGCELVEVSHESDDGESTKDGSGVLPNCSNPVALLIDGVEHGETDHANLVNEQNGPPLRQ